MCVSVCSVSYGPPPKVPTVMQPHMAQVDHIPCGERIPGAYRYLQVLGGVCHFGANLFTRNCNLPGGPVNRCMEGLLLLAELLLSIVFCEHVLYQRSGRMELIAIKYFYILGSARATEFSENNWSVSPPTAYMV